MTFSVQAYIHRIDFFYGSRYCEVAFGLMVVRFWHVHWETFIIPILKTECVYLKPFSFSVSIKINKHCSYSVHICIQELILTVFMFSVLQKIYLTDDHVWHIRKIARPVATHCKKPRDDMIKIAPTVEIYNRPMVQKHPVHTLHIVHFYGAWQSSHSYRY